MRVTKQITLVLWVSLLVVVGCSKDKREVPVAKVGERTISLATFEIQYYAVDEKFIPENKDLEGRKEFLDTMINKEILAMKADELGYDKDEYVLKGMEAFKQVGLQAGYVKLKVMNKIKITEDHLRAAYEFYGMNRKVKQILVDTKEEADEIYDMLKAGHDFESVCKEYSKGPDAEKGGEVVNALYGTFPPEFQDELFATKVGDITHPILSQYGYFVIKVVGQNEPKRKPFEEVRDDLDQLVRNQQQIRLSQAMSDDLRAKHGFEWYEDNILIAFELLPPDRPLTNPPDRSTEVYPLLLVEPQDLEKPLVTWDDKSITLKDFSDLYDRASFFQRPRKQYRLGDIKKFVLDIVMNELVEVEMASSGIENEPEVARMLQRKKEQLMVDKLYQDLIQNQTEVSYNEMEQYYYDNVERFRRSEERRFGAILTGDRTSATEAYKLIQEGHGFEVIQEQYTIDDPEVTGKFRRFLEKGNYPEVDEYGFTIGEVGGVTEPFASGSGWMILKLFEKRPERILSMSEAQADIERYLKTLRSEEKLNELLAKWRGEIKIQVYDKNLMKAELKRQKKRGVKFS
jgi:parvulin-like peptidyl-prolyl isomerase